MRRTSRQGARSRAWAPALVAILALALAPMWNALTHGPGAWVEAATAAAEALDHGHAYAGGPAGHDASDHEHLHAAILPQAFGTPVALPLVRLPTALVLARTRVPEEPERPPRSA